MLDAVKLSVSFAVTSFLVVFLLTTTSSSDQRIASSGSVGYIRFLQCKLACLALSQLKLFDELVILLESCAFKFLPMWISKV